MGRYSSHRPNLENASFQKLGSAFVQLAFGSKHYFGQQQETVSQVVVGVIRVNHRTVSDFDIQLSAVPIREERNVRQLRMRFARWGDHGPVAGQPCVPMLGRAVRRQEHAFMDIARMHAAVKRVFGVKELEVAEVVTVTHID